MAVEFLLLIMPLTRLYLLWNLVMTQVTKSELRGEQTCLKNCSANKLSIAIRFNLLQVCFFFLPPFEFAVLFIPFFMFEPVF